MIPPLCHFEGKRTIPPSMLTEETLGKCYYKHFQKVLTQVEGMSPGPFLQSMRYANILPAWHRMTPLFSLVIE